LIIIQQPLYFLLHDSAPSPARPDTPFVHLGTSLLFHRVWRDFAPFWRVEMGVVAQREKEGVGKSGGRLEGKGGWRAREAGGQGRERMV
jgi:hypothetical protein